jgi:hypothetical protein
MKVKAKAEEEAEEKGKLKVNEKANYFLSFQQFWRASYR